MLQRLTINLSQLERQALKTVAELDLRDIRDEARLIVRSELVRRGFLEPEKGGQAPALSSCIGREDDAG